MAWLTPDVDVERIDLGGGSWVDVVRGLVPRHAEIHDDLLDRAAWRQGRVFRYERWLDEPRLSGSLPHAQHHPALAEAEAWASRRYRVRFDSVGLARYRDARDGVGWHRDRELRWLDDTVIGVLTLGAQRPFLLRPLTGRRRAVEDDLADAIDLRPAGGDLVVMGGRCQAAWLHAVPKTPTPARSRISVQWRWTSRRGRPDTAPSYFAPRRFGGR
jgi:alkylated DNA repair dioxygenase AlkB